MEIKIVNLGCFFSHKSETLFFKQKNPKLLKLTRAWKHVFACRVSWFFLTFRCSGMGFSFCFWQFGVLWVSLQITCCCLFLLQDDKKYYQLELVNRETNFNKVFNASPNVGVINPLIKVGADSETRHTQGGAFLPQRWYPLHPISPPSLLSPLRNNQYWRSLRYCCFGTTISHEHATFQMLLQFPVMNRTVWRSDWAGSRCETTHKWKLFYSKRHIYDVAVKTANIFRVYSKWQIVK